MIWLNLCGFVRFGGIRRGRFNFWMQSRVEYTYDPQWFSVLCLKKDNTTHFGPSALRERRSFPWPLVFHNTSIFTLLMLLCQCQGSCQGDGVEQNRCNCRAFSLPPHPSVKTFFLKVKLCPCAKSCQFSQESILSIFYGRFLMLEMQLLLQF